VRFIIKNEIIIKIMWAMLHCYRPFWNNFWKYWAAQLRIKGGNMGGPCSLPLSHSSPFRWSKRF